MSITLKDLQNRHDAPLVNKRQVAPNGWSYDLWVDNSLLSEYVSCNKCGEREILGVILTLWDSGPPGHEFKTCFDCGNVMLDRNLEVWC